MKTNSWAKIEADIRKHKNFVNLSDEHKAFVLRFAAFVSGTVKMQRGRRVGAKERDVVLEEREAKRNVRGSVIQ